MTDKEFGQMCYVIGIGQRLLNVSTDEVWRQAVFNSVSEYLAEGLQIDPLEYTKERSHNFIKEMSDPILTSIIKKHNKKGGKDNENKL